LFIKVFPESCKKKQPGVKKPDRKIVIKINYAEQGPISGIIAVTTGDNTVDPLFSTM
jgi:hypothetical protein